jgi:hypothetical protein
MSKSRDGQVIDLVREPETGRFVAGHAPLPGGGRPAGLKDKYGGRFLEDVHAVWVEKGREALYAAAKQSPAHYVRSMVYLHRAGVAKLVEQLEGAPVMTEQEVKDTLIEMLPLVFPDLQLVPRKGQKTA